MSDETGTRIRACVEQIPSGLFILTSGYAGVRSGVLTKWVQPCSLEPPHVMIALPRGMPVDPLIRDSHSFALCQIPADDPYLVRRFASPPDRGDDPFFAIATRETPRGSPIIDRALSYLDCEMVRHVPLETEYRLYVGLVHDAAVLREGGRPAIDVGGKTWEGNGLVADEDLKD